MNALFETFVGRLIQRGLQGTGLRAVLQGGLRPCLHLDGKGLFQTRPDILILHGDRVIQVIDTKWKRIAARIDDPKRGVTQGDVYQMLAYAQLYAAPRVTLLYPHHAALGAEAPPVPHAITGSPATLDIATIDIGDPRDLTPRLLRLVALAPG
jgi:5-methylcytosine-specific restriction enzyme subunit McrC